jgi:hypothetical protein
MTTALACRSAPMSVRRSRLGRGGHNGGDAAAGRGRSEWDLDCVGVRRGAGVPAKCVDDGGGVAEDVGERELLGGDVVEEVLEGLVVEHQDLLGLDAEHIGGRGVDGDVAAGATLGPRNPGRLERQMDVEIAPDVRREGPGRLAPDMQGSDDPDHCGDGAGRLVVNYSPRNDTDPPERSRRGQTALRRCEVATAASASSQLRDRSRGAALAARARDGPRR